MVNLRELERFLMSNYVINVDMVEDLLGDLLHKNSDPDEKSTLLLITDTINRLSLLKSRGLWERVTELQVERLIRNCLCPQDQSDFFVEEAKYFTDVQVRDGEEEEDLTLEEWFQKMFATGLMAVQSKEGVVYAVREVHLEGEGAGAEV